MATPGEESGATGFALEAVVDHLALTCPDPLALAKWYRDVFGFQAIDFDEFVSKKRPFPSVRISDGTIIDFFPSTSPTSKSGPGNALNHFCLALKNKDQVENAVARLTAAGFAPDDTTPKPRSGARGMGWSVYANDLAGNTVELRYYE